MTDKPEGGWAKAMAGLMVLLMFPTCIYIIWSEGSSVSFQMALTEIVLFGLFMIFEHIGEQQ
jgi:hypothetical protein